MSYVFACRLWSVKTDLERHKHTQRRFLPAHPHFFFNPPLLEYLTSFPFIPSPQITSSLITGKLQNLQWNCSRLCASKCITAHWERKKKDKRREGIEWEIYWMRDWIRERLDALRMLQFNKPWGRNYFLPLKTICCNPIFERHCRKNTDPAMRLSLFFFFFFLVRFVLQRLGKPQSTASKKILYFEN